MKIPAFAEGDRLLLGLGLLAALLLCFGPVSDPDLPWHLASGRAIVALGAIPRQDVFSWRMAGAPWMDFEWASGLIFHGLDRLGGAAALWCFKSAILFSLAAAFAGLLRSWRLPNAWIGLAAPAFVAAGFPANGLRPEMFSALFFMVELCLLERRRLGLQRWSEGPFLALHVLLYAAWANLHAGFATGIVLCACYAVGEKLEGKPDALRGWSRLLAAIFLATLLNPYGYRIYSVLLEHGRQMGALRGLIEEWRLPMLLLGYLDGYWLLLIFSMTGFLWAAWTGFIPPMEHLAAVVVFTLFASRSIRTTTYAVLLTYPLSLHAWGKMPLSGRWRAILGVSACLATGWIAWRGLGVAGPRRFFSWPPPMEAQGPQRAVAFLRAEKSVLGGLRLYNPYNWGGYLDYTLFPDYRVFIDGRYIFFDLLKEVDSATRSPDRWRGFLGEQGIDLALLDNNGLMLQYPWDRGAHPYLSYAMQYAEWALVYWDSQVMLFVRRSKVPLLWLGGHEFRLLRPFDLRQLGLFVVAGTVSWREVTSEIDRYKKEIGDPEQTLLLERWRREFSKGLPPERLRS